jgi:hypothetical protein
MEIEQESGKTRSMQVNDEADDYGLPIWAARLPVTQTVGEFEECPRQFPGLPIPDGLRGFRAGRRLDETLMESYRSSYGSRTPDLPTWPENRPRTEPLRSPPKRATGTQSHDPGHSSIPDFPDDIDFRCTLTPNQS